MYRQREHFGRKCESILNAVSYKNIIEISYTAKIIYYIHTVMHIQIYVEHLLDAATLVFEPSQSVYAEYDVVDVAEPLGTVALRMMPTAAPYINQNLRQSL